MNEAKNFPSNLGEGKLPGIQENGIHYLEGLVDKILYQGLAWLKLGQKEKADALFSRLIQFGKKHMNDNVSIDYFAVSLPDLLVFETDLDLRNKIHCLYMIAFRRTGTFKY